MKRPFCLGTPEAFRIGLGQSGFTLIETMVTIAIAAILMALAAPSMRSLIERNSVADSVDSFVSAISHTRAEAVRRGLPVTLCRSADAATSSTPACSADPAWQAGWMAFVDLDGDGVFESSQGDSLLRVQGALDRSGTIIQGNPEGDGSYASLRFRPTGTLKNGASTFIFKSPSDIESLKRGVCVGFVGRVRLISGTESCS
jgi:type IV fimbrial biogenesis protein FimT